VAHSDRCRHRVQREALDVRLGDLPVVRFYVYVKRRHAASPAVQSELGEHRLRAVADAGSQHQRVPVLAQYAAMIIGVRLDQKSRPVPLHLEEETRRIQLSGERPALDEKSVPSLLQQFVDERRYAHSGEIHIG